MVNLSSCSYCRLKKLSINCWKEINDIRNVHFYEYLLHFYLISQTLCSKVPRKRNPLITKKEQRKSVDTQITFMLEDIFFYIPTCSKFSMLLDSWLMPGKATFKQQEKTDIWFSTPTQYGFFVKQHSLHHVLLA